MDPVPPFVDSAWLRDHPEAVLVDVRTESAYAAGHLPGAVHVDLDTWLAGAPGPGPGRHPLPTPEHFAEGMRTAGVSDPDVVVAYDGDGGVMAARLVWMLRVTGHRAAVLDGGRPGTDLSAPHRPRGTFTATPWPQEHLSGIDEIQGRVLLDARPADRFHGLNETLDPRAGHVPGAVSVPCRENLDSTGHLLSEDLLRERLAPVTDGWVSLCGSGVTACHTLLVAEHLGLPPGRLFPGSWSQWAATDRPLAT